MRRSTTLVLCLVAAGLSAGQAGPAPDQPAAERGPKADQVLSIKLGNPPEPRGIFYRSFNHEDQPLFETVNGRSCMRTNHEAGVHYLRFRTDPDFWHKGPTPVVITVEYLDRGNGTFAVKYASYRGGHGSDSAQTASVQKNGTGAWEKAVFRIPDAWSDHEQGVPFWITSENWKPGDDDDWFGAVEIRMGGLVVEPSEALIAADPSQSLELSITAIAGAALEVPDDATVELTAGGGVIEPQATLQNGRAKVFFAAPLEPGVVPVTVKLGEFTATCQVQALEGTGKIVEQEVTICNFTPAEVAPEGPWGASSVLAEVAAEPVADPEAEDGQALKLSWTFQQPQNASCRAVVHQPTALPGIPVGLRLRFKGDASRAVFWVLFVDSVGQLFYLPVHTIYRHGWDDFRTRFERPRRVAGNAGDGQWHPPVSFLELRVLNAPNRPSRAQGEVLLDSLSFWVTAPESVLEK